MENNRKVATVHFAVRRPLAISQRVKLSMSHEYPLRAHVASIEIRQEQHLMNGTGIEIDGKTDNVVVSELSPNNSFPDLEPGSLKPPIWQVRSNIDSSLNIWTGIKFGTNNPGSLPSTEYLNVA